MRSRGEAKLFLSNLTNLPIIRAPVSRLGGNFLYVKFGLFIAGFANPKFQPSFEL